MFLKNWHILVFFLLLANLYSIGAAYGQDASALPASDFSALRKTGEAQVLEVISPLTVKLSNGDIVRLPGLHFPDYDYTAERTGPFALTAMKVLQDMLEGKKVEIYQTPKKDWGRTNRMGHALAHLVRSDSGLWAQGMLIRLGLAQVKTSQRNPEMAAQLYALEAEARHEKIGIWENDDVILSPEDALKHLNSFQIVEGVIQSAAMKKNRVYLNFGGNWRNDFTVSIAPEDRRIFSKAEINPLDWNGAHVRVRGWVEEYNGAYIEIDHPEALEILSAGDDVQKRPNDK
ncbi:MAG TPA: thermonuclease family protein [Alphaproteobacteria bacterium]|nr:thermonuclease family protein [Alphaproteobacteria bacterium]USO06411.1 MAG: thermonuclease family protein [Rhodospirillales bacterium]HOO81810.1 thermonuclease family protein [Alphaproteobacteria bacterium]